MNNDWVNRQEYAFAPHYFTTTEGQMHYVDEGKGKPIVMVHGTPVWSYVYRKMIKDLSANYRCIAMDHLGFGLSDKPPLADYSPQAHAQRLTDLISHLQLEDITLVVHDFGGPIGLSYTLAQPDQVKQLVIFNTWMWSLNEYPEFVRAGKIASSPLGRFLYKYFNFSPKVLIKQAFFDKAKLTKVLQQQYIKAFPDTKTRGGTIAFAKHLLSSSEWYNSLWQQKEKLKDIAMLILWGKKDTLLTPILLKKWKENFAHAQIEELEAGHFVQEEKPAEAIMFIRAFLAKEKTKSLER
ncbi:alpha/beta fold hydrolase [Porifericola rhodea]|uniref:alpha/beta fold hydrolase n=1 Tax=Porifericola rhodea TaxID=930972 RepID=UPI0026652313|nr:alpha/beta fold hydrolase [Porifericola rhodea]WKN33075.1 alpha/beta fold hydrolase [Porifericola rhodea]